MFVHVGCAGDSIFLAMSDDPEQLVLVTDVDLSEVLNIAALLILPYFQIIFADIE